MEQKAIDPKLQDIITQVNQNGSTMNYQNPTISQIKVPALQPFKSNISIKKNRISAFISQLCSCFSTVEQQQPKLSEKNQFILPPISAENLNKKTLVLDLDETLVHSSFQPSSKPDIIVQVEIEQRMYDVYILKRPGVDEFLASLAPIYELVIYTASLSKYANPLLDKLDTYGLCSHRVFRESCTLSEGQYVKDLTKLGRNMKDVIIIDIDDVRTVLRRALERIEQQLASPKEKTPLILKEKKEEQKVQGLIKFEQDESLEQFEDTQRSLEELQIRQHVTYVDNLKYTDIHFDEIQNEKIVNNFFNKANVSFDIVRSKAGINSPTSSNRGEFFKV